MSYFLKIDGIPGESSTLPYLHWIEVEEFAFGTTSGHLTSGLSRNPPLNAVVFSAKLDSSFPKLRLAAVLGKPIHSATIAGTSNSSLLEITLTECIVSSVQASNSRNGAHVQFTLSCKSMNTQHGHVKSVANKQFSPTHSLLARGIP